MNVTVNYSDTARKQLQKLEVTHSRRILKKITEHVASEDPLRQAKPLSGRLIGKYRYRIGDYRVIFSVNEEGVIVVLTVLTIEHRKDVYR